MDITDKLTDDDKELSSYIDVIRNDLKELDEWIKKFPDDSVVILNYGDLLASFPMSSLDKEDSVKIIADFKNNILSSNKNEAKNLFKFLINRWTNIEFANQKDLSKSSN